MPVVAFLVEPYTYAVYHYFDDTEIEITEVDDALMNLVEFDPVYDPFRTENLVVIDLSRLPS